MNRGTSEFLPLTDDAVRAVSGLGGRHAALIEDAFHILVETPGGGLSLKGDAKARRDVWKGLPARRQQLADARDAT